jgi:hypothetical protein
MKGRHYSDKCIDCGGRRPLSGQGSGRSIAANGQSHDEKRSLNHRITAKQFSAIAVIARGGISRLVFAAGRVNLVQTSESPPDPAETVAPFAVAPGSRVIPWQLEFSAIEEDIFIRVVSQPASWRNLMIDGWVDPRAAEQHYRARACDE